MVLPGDSTGPADRPCRYNAAEKTWTDGETAVVTAPSGDRRPKTPPQSLAKGSRVVVIGTLVSRTYTPFQGPNAGVEQTRLEVIVDEIGPSLRWAEATLRKTERTKAADNGPDTDPRAGGVQEPPF